MMKKLFFLTAVVLTACSAPAPEANPVETTPSADLSIVQDMPTIQAFTQEAVLESDLQQIVQAGINCPSAMNGQPWHFTVITNPETMKTLSTAMQAGMEAMMKNRPAPAPKPETKDGDKPEKDPKDAPKPDGPRGPHSGVGDSPCLIVISCKDDSELDAGLATQNMNAMANLLGYGTKIASSIQILLQGDKAAELNTLFGVPEGMHVTTSLLIGKVDTEAYDATTSATPRNSEETVVTYVK